MTDVMVDISDVSFLVCLNDVVDEAFLQRIKTAAYSRIPVSFSREDSFICGILLTKSLIGVNPFEKKTVLELFRSQKIKLTSTIYLCQTTTLLTAQKVFAKGFSHMGIVCKDVEAAKHCRDTADMIFQ